MIVHVHTIQRGAVLSIQISHTELRSIRTNTKLHKFDSHNHKLITRYEGSMFQLNSDTYLWFKINYKFYLVWIRMVDVECIYGFASFFSFKKVKVT